jgi:hypothetical protein
LKAFKFNGTTFQSSPVSQGSVLAAVGVSNTVPLSVSANGTQAGTGIVWASAPYSGDANAGAVPGILYAFDASDLSHELWDSKQNTARDDIGNYAKFSPPTIANGKVYVPTFSGQLTVYGLTNGDFSIKAEPDLITQSGQTANTTLKIIPQANGLTSPASLSCSDLPAGTKCTFTPPSLPPGSATMQSTLTVSAGSLVANSNGGSKKFLPGGWLWVAGFCLGAAPFTDKHRRQAVWRIALVIIAAGLLVGLGCGGGGGTRVPDIAISPTPVLPTGKITVVAVSGWIEHTSMITLAMAGNADGNDFAAAD